jgi:hypothetical protein
MPDIMVLFACLSQCLDTTTLRQLSRVTEAMLAMTGRVTMRGLHRPEEWLLDITAMPGKIERIFNALWARLRASGAIAVGEAVEERIPWYHQKEHVHTWRDLVKEKPLCTPRSC